MLYFWKRKSTIQVNRYLLALFHKPISPKNTQWCLLGGGAEVSQREFLPLMVAGKDLNLQLGYDVVENTAKEV